MRDDGTSLSLVMDVCDSYLYGEQAAVDINDKMALVLRNLPHSIVAREFAPDAVSGAAAVEDVAAEIASLA